MYNRLKNNMAADWLSGEGFSVENILDFPLEDVEGNGLDGDVNACFQNLETPWFSDIQDMWVGPKSNSISVSFLFSVLQQQ